MHMKYATIGLVGTAICVYWCVYVFKGPSVATVPQALTSIQHGLCQEGARFHTLDSHQIEINARMGTYATTDGKIMSFFVSISKSKAFKFQRDCPPTTLQALSCPN